MLCVCVGVGVGVPLNSRPMASYGKGGTTPHSGVRMCQRLLVGYRLELVAICVHAMPYMKIP